MQVKAELNYLRIAPRKTRQIADLVRGKKAVEAANILEFVVRRPAEPILKLLKSALATAENTYKLDPANFYIFKITVDEGPKLKRFRPVSRGTAHRLWKRTSHVQLILAEITPTLETEIKELKKKLEVTTSEGKTGSAEKKDKQKFDKQRDSRSQKGQDKVNRIFRRKSI